MENYRKLAELCSNYAMNLGLVFDVPVTLATGQTSIHIPKKRIRELCKDQLDDQENVEIKRLVFNALRDAAASHGWGEVDYDEDRYDYILNFHKTSETRTF